MEMPICKPCGFQITEGSAYIAGIRKEGKLEWRAACEHRPAPNAEVCLGSTRCSMRWMNEHPEDSAQIIKVELLMLSTNGCHPDVN